MGEASRTYDDAILKMLLELCFFAPSSTQPAMANVAKLLLLQGGKCFYCGNRLALEDATIDHVLAKALGGDNSEANTVACCHSINQVFGHATPKEKLTAIINAGGRIDCPPKPAKKALPVEATIPTQEPIQPVPPAVLLQKQLPKPQPAQKATAKSASPKPTKQKTAPEKKPSELRKPLQEAFHAAAAVNGGGKALLTIVSLELRKRVPGFVVKRYGEKTFARLITVLGYRVDKDWCSPQKLAAV